MPITRKKKRNISTLEFIKKFEHYLKPSLKKVSLPEGSRLRIQRLLNFRREKVCLMFIAEFSDKRENETLLVVEAQNVQYAHQGSAFLGCIRHFPDERNFDFLYIVDSVLQLDTAPYELVNVFLALARSEPIPESRSNQTEEIAEASAAVSEEDTFDAELTEEDIENMTPEEIQAMMEREVARTKGSSDGGDDSAASDEPAEESVDDIMAALGGVPGQDDDPVDPKAQAEIEAMMAAAMGGEPEAPATAATPSSADEEPIDSEGQADIDAMMAAAMGGDEQPADEAGSTVDAAATDEKVGGQDELDDLLGSMGMPGIDEQESTAGDPGEAAAEEPVAKVDEAGESLSEDEIAKMVAEKAAEDEAPEES